MTTAALPSDQDSRRLAAARLDQNVVVSAGAGTGKTRLLINRLTLLILGQKLPVDKIVALTFTKKAAEEMRDRLERRLREIIADPSCFDLLNENFPAPDEERVALALRALDDIPKAQIGTIHSFAGHLLRLYPVQADVDPAFREDDGTAFDALFESEWHAWLTKELAEGAPRAERWAAWLAANDLGDLKELARALAQLDDPSIVPGKPASLAPLIEETLGLLNNFIARLGIPRTAPRFVADIEAVRRVLEAAKVGKKAAPVDLDEVAALGTPKPPKDWAGEDDVLRELPAIFRRTKALALVDETAAADACRAVIPFAVRMRRELGRRGTLSFDDLLVKARNLLRDKPTVRAALKRQYATFLVDEFQDTDPLQGEILFYLAEAEGREAPQWRDVALAPGRLFVVGDPKQSIYRFRGADIAAFEESWNRLIQQGALKATLSQNFRSCPHIIQTVNAIFPSVMKQAKYLQPLYEPLEAGRESIGPEGCEVVTTATPPEETVLADDLRVFESTAVADWIERHVGAKVGGATLRFSDIAILLRGTSAFHPYLETLRERGIPFLAEGEKTYYRPEVLELTNLLAVIANPDDQLALAGVLRSPLGGLSDVELMQLSEARGLDVRKHPPLFGAKISALYETLRLLAVDAHARPVPDMVKAVFDATWVLEVSAGRRHSEQAIANLRKVLMLAEKWLEAGPMTLAGFVARLRAYREDKKDEGENPLADVQFDAVRVMTIHKAKGLEFPVVFLPNLSAGSSKAAAEKEPLLMDWRTGHMGVRIPGSGAINAARLLIDEDVARREAAEEVRVFYVAMTRAKERLVLLVKDEPKSSALFAGYLGRAGVRPIPDCLTITAAGVELPLTWLTWTRATPPSNPGQPTGFTKGWDASALATVFKTRALERFNARRARLILTPTAQIQARKAAAEPEKRALSADDEADLDRHPAIMIGHICHAVMELWDFNTPSDGRSKALRAAVEAAALRFGLLPENPDRDAIVTEAAGIMETFAVSPAFAKLSQAQADDRLSGREIPFFFPMATGDAARVMRGVMDVVYTEGETIVVGDYKTNRVDEATLKTVAETYRAQGDAYVRAIRTATGKKAAFELIFLRTGKTLRLV